jgi:hypothetical protein
MPDSLFMLSVIALADAELDGLLTQVYVMQQKQIEDATSTASNPPSAPQILLDKVRSWFC